MFLNTLMLNFCEYAILQQICILQKPCWFLLSSILELLSNCKPNTREQQLQNAVVIGTDFFTKLLLFWQTADMAHTKCPPSFSNPLINGQVLDGIFKRSVFLAFAQSNYHQKNWGVSTTGKSILAKRSNFKPVFYVINDIIHSQTPNFDPNPR